MGLWGATAGMAVLVGPILGGVLVDGLGWEWIFFVNVPIGIVAFIMVMRFVPKLTTHSHTFDVLGVVLSAVGMFLLVFGIEEGQTYKWGTITGAITVWGLIITGLLALAVFVLWQWLLARRGGEPLLPLGLFKDRNFSLGNTTIMAVGFTVTAFPLPTIFYYQVVRGLTPTQSALLMIPMAILSGALAPFVGRLIDRANPRWFASFGLVCLAGALFWTSSLLGPDTPIWMFLLPSALQGVANGFIWGPVSNATTRNLAGRQAGAGSGVFNTTRQIGAVLGSAAIAALIQARLAAELPAAAGGASASEASMSGVLPQALHAGFSTAMSQAILLPAFAILIGALVALFFAKPKAVDGWGGAEPDRKAAAFEAAP